VDAVQVRTDGAGILKEAVMIYTVWVSENGREIFTVSTTSKNEALDAFESKQAQQADVHMTCSDWTPEELADLERCAKQRGIKDFSAGQR
jgi:hypothetical protein